eukprot:TRINITY_DN1390_c0_g2_i2.p1 TRINITY_DN1390_c0_g2~~TRINITY_DN1390_c0_g2_i2.p1  ORF type:complete len:154 (-),score=27.56 TRINITY_DN1390_c0_g2_i2:45-506(-)
MGRQVLFLNWIIGQPLLESQQSNGSDDKLNGFDALGCLLWVTGFFFEAVGDFQLAKFKSDPANKGKLLTTGLWKLTRHPNYFGNSCMWWGFYSFSVAAGNWKTIYSPILMTFLLLKVSGVALLEKGLSKSKPQFQEYIASTPSFIPSLRKLFS